MDVNSQSLVWTGSAWESARGNVSNISPIAALVTAAVGSNGADQVNPSGRGLKLVIDITALTGTAPTLTVTIQGKDPVSGKYYTILASAALAAVATTVLTVYPGLVAAANLTVNDVLPRDWRVITAIAGTAPTVTATIAASIIK
jgi:hypothetical protein